MCDLIYSINMFVILVFLKKQTKANANLAYIQYCTNYPEAMRELSSALKSNARFQEFISSIGLKVFFCFQKNVFL